MCFLADDGDVEVGGNCEMSKWTLWHWVFKEFGALVAKHHQKALDQGWGGIVVALGFKKEFGALVFQAS